VQDDFISMVLMSPFYFQFLKQHVSRWHDYVLKRPLSFQFSSLNNNFFIVLTRREVKIYYFNIFLN
jgi:hypothetical protein